MATNQARPPRVPTVTQLANRRIAQQLANRIARVALYNPADVAIQYAITEIEHALNCASATTGSVQVP
jgi:hypothetical protein